MVRNHQIQTFCGHLRAKIQLKWSKKKSILNTHPISVHATFELDYINAFSDKGQNPRFSVILLPLEGLKLANVVQNRINSENLPNKGTHSPKSVYTKSELDCMKTFSDNGWKPKFSVIVLPLEGQKLANMAQKQITTGHSTNKCTPQIWIGLCEHFSR